MKENGSFNTRTNARNLSQHILKLFPTAKRDLKKTKTTSTIYRGLKLKPIEIITPTIEFEAIKQYFPENSVVKEDRNSITCSLGCDYSSNGNQIYTRLLMFLKMGNGNFKLVARKLNYQIFSLTISTYAVKKVLRLL